jgi:hypothetical protein
MGSAGVLFFLAKVEGAIYVVVLFVFSAVFLFPLALGACTAWLGLAWFGWVGVVLRAFALAASFD